MYIRNRKNNEVYYVADSASIGQPNQVVLVEKLNKDSDKYEGYYLPIVVDNDDIESYKDDMMSFITDKGELFVGNDMEQYSELNIDIIDDASIEDVLESYSNVPDFQIPYSDEDSFIVPENDDDNFLCTAVKRVCAAKNVPLKAYGHKFDKAHELTNLSKAIRIGKITEKKFQSIADIMDYEYCVIVQDKEDSKYKMETPVIVSSPGFNFKDKKVFSSNIMDMVNAFKK